MRLDFLLPSGFDSTVQVTRAGQPVATFETGSLRERVAFEVDGVAYRAEKSRADGVLVLTNEATGLPEAQVLPVDWTGTDRDVEAAMPSGAFHQIRFDRVDGAEARIELRAGGAVVGHLRREGLFEHHVEAHFPDAWPLPLGVFLGWLAARQFGGEDAALLVVTIL